MLVHLFSYFFGPRILDRLGRRFPFFRNNLTLVRIAILFMVAIIVFGIILGIAFLSGWGK